MWTTQCFHLKINTTRSNSVLQCRYSIHVAHQQMIASIIYCMINSRLTCNVGLSLVYQDQQRFKSHEHNDVLPKLKDGRSSKSYNFWALDCHSKLDLWRSSIRDMHVERYLPFLFLRLLHYFYLLCHKA